MPVGQYRSNSLALRFLRLRAQGVGTHEAGRLAGYAALPPLHTRRLAAKLPLVRAELKTPGFRAALEGEIAQLDRQIAKLRRERLAKRATLLLCDVLTADAE